MILKHDPVTERRGRPVSCWPFFFLKKTGAVFGGDPHGFLAGGFNPSEKYKSKLESSPSRGENIRYLKPPPSFFWSAKIKPTNK